MAEKLYTLGQAASILGVTGMVRVLSLQGVADAVGKSKRQIQRAVERGELATVYIDSLPSVRVADLDEWVASLPEAPPA